MQYRLLSILCFLFAVQVHAQDDVEYRMEVGVGAGLVSYQGDFNGSVVKNLQPMGSLVWRYVFNPRMALRVMGSYGKLKGNSTAVKTYYPEWAKKSYQFAHQAIWHRKRLSWGKATHPFCLWRSRSYLCFW